VMVDRGDCTFVTKVRNIEHLGVKMAIIADDKLENTEQLIMADDGSGRSITIPSFMIRKRDADKLKQHLENNDFPVYIKGSLEIAHPDNRVEYQLWYSSVLDLEPQFVEEMARYNYHFANATQFTPRIMTYSCEFCTKEVKNRECLNDGKYCPFAPRLEHAEEYLLVISGADLLKESLRQRCVYETLATGN
jgi:hypothetical protein